MSSSRLRLVLRAILGVGILVFIVIVWQGLSTLSAKSTQLTDLKLREKTVEAQLSSLATAKKEVETYSYFKEVAKSVIPADKDQAQAVLDITRLASEASINIGSITFPTSTLGGQQSTKSAATTQTNAKSASSKAALSQAKPVEGGPGLYSLELTITPEFGTQVPDSRKVTYPKLLDFLNRLEKNRRTAQIAQITIKPEADKTQQSPYIDFSLIINIFIKP